MARARMRHDWDRTAWLTLHVAEPWRDRKTHPQPYTVADFHPMEQARGTAGALRWPKKLQFRMLKSAFVKGGPKRTGGAQ